MRRCAYAVASPTPDQWPSNCSAFERFQCEQRGRPWPPPANSAADCERAGGKWSLITMKCDVDNVAQRARQRSSGRRSDCWRASALRRRYV
jgi:hypothetical protein